METFYRNENFCDLPNKIAEQVETKLRDLIEYNEIDCRGTEFLLGHLY